MISVQVELESGVLVEELSRDRSKAQDFILDLDAEVMSKEFTVELICNLLETMVLSKKDVKKLKRTIKENKDEWN